MADKCWNLPLRLGDLLKQDRVDFPATLPRRVFAFAPHTPASVLGRAVFWPAEAQWVFLLPGELATGRALTLHIPTLNLRILLPDSSHA